MSLPAPAGIMGNLSRERVREVIGRVAASGRVTAADGTEHRIFPVAVSPQQGAALRDLVVAEGASKTIEVGLGYGISALYLCEGLLTVGSADPRHSAVDPYQWTRFAGIGLQLLDQAGVASMVEHHAGESQVVLPGLVAEGRRFDLAFLDGNHRFDRGFVDLYFLGRLVRPGGVVVVDDVQLPAIAKAVGFFVANREWTVEATSRADRDHHWMVVRTPAEPDEQPFTFFVDF